MVVEDPLRERRWAILALAQYRCGRQGDALRSLTRARRTLVDELGIDYLERRNGYIEAVTLEDVRRAARRLYDPNALVVVVVGDPGGVQG